MTTQQQQQQQQSQQKSQQNNNPYFDPTFDPSFNLGQPTRIQTKFSFYRTGVLIHELPSARTTVHPFLETISEEEEFFDDADTCPEAFYKRDYPQFVRVCGCVSLQCLFVCVLLKLYLKYCTFKQVRFQHAHFRYSLNIQTSTKVSTHTHTYTHISSTNYQHTHSKIPTKKNSKLFISKTKLKQNHLVTGTGCAHGIQNQPVFAEGSCAAISNRCKTIEERKRRNQNLQNFDLTDERAPNKVQF